MEMLERKAANMTGKGSRTAASRTIKRIRLVNSVGLHEKVAILNVAPPIKPEIKMDRTLLWIVVVHEAFGDFLGDHYKQIFDTDLKVLMNVIEYFWYFGDDDSILIPALIGDATFSFATFFVDVLVHHNVNSKQN